MTGNNYMSFEVLVILQENLRNEYLQPTEQSLCLRVCQKQVTQKQVFHVIPEIQNIMQNSILRVKSSYIRN